MEGFLKVIAESKDAEQRSEVSRVAEKVTRIIS